MSDAAEKAGEEAGKRNRPWRDNIEAFTVSIIVIVLFKYFILEAYKIPTGSMQPTLMGWTPSARVVQQTGKAGGLHDRVLVDKLSFHFRDPERWEVVVFKYPLDRSKNFIKRIVGMPNEELEVRGGDLYAGPRGGELKVLRRPRSVLESMLLPLETEGKWKLESGDWTAKNGRIGGERPGTASYPRHTSGVRDQYEDGYPPSIREAMRIEGVVQGPGLNGVGDLRLETQLTAASDTTEVQIKLTEDQRHYTFSFPGPAADGSARCTVTTPTGEVFTAESAFQLTSASMDVAIENIDDLLRLEVDGEILVEVEVAPVIGNEGGRLRLASLGGGAIFDHVRVLRDIYYTSKGYKRSTWEIPDESYVMLGDNTLNSSDGRDWAFANFSVPVGDERVTIRGNSRRQAPAPGLIPRGAGNSQAGEHPYVVRRTGEPDQVFLHDEWGDRWVFDSPPAQDLGDEDFPFVHRSLIQGRAVMVVWPLSPGRGIYRIQWVR